MVSERQVKIEILDEFLNEYEKETKYLQEIQKATGAATQGPKSADGSGHMDIENQKLGGVVPLQKNNVRH